MNERFDYLYFPSPLERVALNPTTWSSIKYLYIFNFRFKMLNGRTSTLS